MKNTEYLYDVFISHAIEDKIPIANELCERLESKDLKVWYSGKGLHIGDHVSEAIHSALDQCRFGVVILSPTYVTKHWALKELFILSEKQKKGQKVILPVLYNITPEELAAKSIEIANLFAIRAEKGLDHVTEKLYEEIQKQQKQEIHDVTISQIHFNRHALVFGFIFFALLIGTYVFYRNLFQPTPNRDIVEKAIKKRIEDVQLKANVSLQESLQKENGTPVTAEEIKTIYTDYLNTKSYFRNEYTLHTGHQVIRSKKNVAAALSLDLESFSPFNLYTFSTPSIYRCHSPFAKTSEANYIFYNTQPVTYRLEELKNADESNHVKVTYTNPVRLIYTSLVFPSSSSDTKRHHMTITGLRPSEIYTFTKSDNSWILKEIE